MLLDGLCSILHTAVMTETQQLLARVEALAERTGKKRSTLSRELFGNGKRFDEIKAGGSLTMATFERAVERLNQLERAA